MSVASAHGGIQTAPNPKPGSPGYLKWYWIAGPGRAKWSSWTELHDHLVKHMGPAMAKRVTQVWYHEATGLYGGSDANRVAHGKPPRGKIVGPG